MTSLAKVVIEYLRRTVGLEAAVAAIGELQSDVETIAITIEVAGDVRGPVTWIFPEAVALELVRRLMADPDPSPDLAVDGAAELANILTGRAAAELERFGFRCEFGVPQHCRGTPPPGVKMRMATADGPIDLVLSMSRTRAIPVLRGE
jgi:CheY-specific phosphatase CheX